MAHILVSQLNAQGYFVGQAVADESPLEPGVYLIPANAVNSPPPDVPEGQRAKWDGGWLFEDIPEPEPETEPELSPEEQQAQVQYQRRAAYQREADPLFFKAQRGEATMDEWTAKVEEIRLRFPDVMIEV